MSKRTKGDRAEAECSVPGVVCPYHTHHPLHKPGGLARALSGPTLHRASLYQRNNLQIVKGTL